MLKRLFLAFSIGCVLCTPGFALDASLPVVKVQANDVDYRVSVLEERNRQLLGEIEELKFRLLELQEQMRRIQEDNEFRFQQLEEKQGSLPAGDDAKVAETGDGFVRLGKDDPSAQQAGSAVTDGETVAGVVEDTTPKRTIDGVEIYEGEGGQDTNLAGSLGTIRFDANGNIIDANREGPNAPISLGQGNTPLPETADALFQTGFDLVQIGQYARAGEALSTFSERYPEDPRLLEARFWLGESHLGLGQYREAAEIYLDAHKRWPNSKFGPQSLLKLGVSVAGMNQRELACATFAEVLQKYPQASRAVRRNVAFEQRAARCAIN